MSERLLWMRYDERQSELLVQLEDSGFSQRIRVGTKAEFVVYGLRHLANAIEEEMRASDQPKGDL